MKDNLIHLCFIIDESGSMYGSQNDVIGGFNNLIEEQRKVTDGECLVSVYRFASDVSKDFIGKPLEEVGELQYNPGGGTAMNDGIGMAIHEIGVWLNNMDESERPSKNMIIIMTDGEENMSREYTLEKVKEMIKHQEDKYNWSFVYMGSDISSLDDAKALGISLMSVSSKGNITKNYANINSYASSFRCARSNDAVLLAQNMLQCELEYDTQRYEAENGIKV